jgi:NADH-quinone oxidoreductase subunit J
METILFVVLGAIAIAAALGVIIARKAIYSALSLLVNFCSLAGLYLLLNAQFLAAAQVIVYAGAIVVLFLFATMLLGGGEEARGTSNHALSIAEGVKRQTSNYLAIVLAFALLVEAGYVFLSGALTGTQGSDTPEAIARIGNVQAIGKLLFTDYLLPFELAAVLLLIGIVGAVVLAKKKPKIRNTKYEIRN